MSYLCNILQKKQASKSMHHASFLKDLFSTSGSCLDQLPVQGHSNNPSPLPVNASNIIVPQTYQDGVVHRWDNLITVNYKQNSWNIVLIKEGNQLKYQLENRQTGEKKGSNISFPNSITSDQMIKGLIERAEPVVEDQDTISFSLIWKEESLPQEVEGHSRSVRLLKGQRDWFWQKWDSFDQLRHYIPIYLTIPSGMCGKQSRKKIALISRCGVSDSVQELAKYRCVSFQLKPVVKFLPAPKHDYATSSWDRQPIDIPCRAKFQVDTTGKVTIYVTDRDIRNFGQWDEDKSIHFDYEPCGDLEVYLAEDEGITKWIFLTSQEAQKKPWMSVKAQYSARIPADIYSRQVKIELIPKGFPAIIHPCVLETKCTQTLYKKEFDSCELRCLLHSCFELSFPAQTALQIPKQQVTCLELEPISASSCIDETVPITHFEWRFTLLASTAKADYALPEFVKNNHAVGALELLNDGFFPDEPLHQVVRILFHYTSEKIEIKKVKNFHWHERSEMFPVYPEAGKELINALKQATPPRFDWRGKAALFGSGHNCFTWLQDYLKIIRVDMGPNFLGIFATRTKNWTKKEHAPQNVFL